MEDNKKDRLPEGGDLPDIDFKKQEELSSTLQFKVADAINKAKQNKEGAVQSQKEAAEQEHFVIDVSTKSVDRVGSVDLLSGEKKREGAQTAARPARQSKAAPSRAVKAPPPPRSSSRQSSRAEGSKGGSSSQGRKKKRMSKRKKVLIIGGIIFVFLFAIFLIVYSYFHKWNSLLKTDDGKIDSTFSLAKDTESSNTIDKESEEERIKAELRKNAASIMNEEGVQNILIIGEDIRDTALEERGNTAVMMIVSLDDNNKRIIMSSFLRDTYTPIPGYYSSKLNAAYGYGGVELLEATLQQDYAINIDRYVIVNFNSFIEIVDAVGGLDLDVSFTEAVAMRDPLDEQNYYLKNKQGKGYIDFDQYGKDESYTYVDYENDEKLRTYIEYNSADDNSIMMHLNGNQSLAYARSRYGCGDDYGRASRQREAIVEMIKKAKGLSFSELDELAEKVASQVRTDINENEVAGLILNAFSYMSYDIDQLQVPAEGTFSNQIIDGLDCLSVDFTANARILQETIYGKTNIEGGQSGGPFADADGDGINDYYVDNDGDGRDDNMLDLDGDGIDDRAWGGTANVGGAY